MSLEDIQAKEDFFKYYAAAPIFFGFSDKPIEGLEDLLKTWNDQVTMKIGDISEQMNDAFIEASEIYESLINNDIKVKFNEFDLDGSGGIDTHELSELSKKLGKDLSPEDLDANFKEIDIAGNGMIDIHEFARWYFSGMKFANFHTTKMSITPEQMQQWADLTVAGDAARKWSNPNSS